MPNAVPAHRARQHRHRLIKHLDRARASPPGSPPLSPRSSTPTRADARRIRARRRSALQQRLLRQPAGHWQLYLDRNSFPQMRDAGAQARAMLVAAAAAPGAFRRPAPFPPDGRRQPRRQGRSHVRRTGRRGGAGSAPQARRSRTARGLDDHRQDLPASSTRRQDQRPARSTASTFGSRA